MTHGTGHSGEPGHKAEIAFRPTVRPALAFVPLATYQEAGLLASGTVSLTTSHRRTTQAFLSALASACRNTTVFSGRNEITKSSPSGRITTFRLSARLITPIRSDMKAPPLADALPIGIGRLLPGLCCRAMSHAARLSYASINCRRTGMRSRTSEADAATVPKT